MKKEELMRRTDQGMRVFQFYMGQDVRLKRKLLSPLRPEKHPSFNLYLHRATNEIWFKDFGAGEDLTGNCINFVMHKENMDYFSAKDFIASTILNELQNSYRSKKFDMYAMDTLRAAVKEKKEVVITPVWKEWSPVELNWWLKFGITQDILEKFHVSSCSKYYKETEYGTKEIIATYSNPIYAIGINGRYKIYRPLAERKFKWLSNLKGDTDIFGFDLLPAAYNGELQAFCFLLAGQKDTMSFHALTGLPAIALNSESAHLPNEIAKYLLMNFRRIFVFYDNDETGNKNAMSIGEKYGFTVINSLLDIAPEVKDFAELVEKRPDLLPEFMQSLKACLGV